MLLSGANLRFGYAHRERFGYAHRERFGYGGRASRRARRADRRVKDDPDVADRVIDGVSLDVSAGEVVGILGPNGSGKTTLLRLLSGALQPDAGSVRLGGADLSSLPRRALAQRIAVVPQETSLTFDYTVLEIVLMGRYPHLGAFEVEGPADLTAAQTALQATGTSAFADRPFRTLSGGEKQRVVIASALAQLDKSNGLARRPVRRSFSEGGNLGEGGSESRLLLLDEPTASLDLRYQFEIGAVLRRLHDASGITILLSTHDLRFAASLCTRVVLLSAGHILAEGPPHEVLTPELVGRLFDVAPHLVAPILSSAALTP